MKKVLFTLVFTLIAFNLNAQSSDKKGAVIEFEEEVIDYGTIEKNADGNRQFIIKNTGTAPLVITNVKGSCGCTVPTKPKGPIMPGKSDVIKVKYATNRVGPFSKTVTVKSNAVNAPVKTVRIKGTVLKEMPSVMEKSKKTKKKIVEVK